MAFFNASKYIGALAPVSKTYGYLEALQFVHKNKHAEVPSVYEYKVQVRKSHLQYISLSKVRVLHLLCEPSD